MNLRYPFIAVVLITACVSIYYSSRQEDKFAKATKMLAMRQIGHELLLASGDSTSRVLPVTEISDQEYQLSFQRPFSFKPDSLVDVTRRIMKKDRVSDNYIVNVAEPLNPGSVVYGFSISEKGNSIVGCRGRSVPVNKYKVNIMLSSSVLPVSEKGNYIVVLWTASLIVGFSFLKLRKVNPECVRTVDLANFKTIRIGGYHFYPGELLLTINGQKTVLTDKESKLLNIFSNNINTVIDRNRLLKEGWEDEGVITHRSLDMYVSRLRKKLSNDPSVRITNIHGKGYCLKDT